MASISRQLSIHASSDPTHVPISVHYLDGTGWFTITVSAEEKINVFLTAHQMRYMAERLIAAADEAVPAHHLDEVSS